MIGLCRSMLGERHCGLIRISGTSDTFLWAVGCGLYPPRTSEWLDRTRDAPITLSWVPSHIHRRATLCGRRPLLAIAINLKFHQWGALEPTMSMACRKGTFCKRSRQESSLRLQEVSQAQKRRKLWRRRRKHTSAEQCELWQRTRKQASANRYHFTRAVLLRLPLLLLLLLLLLLDRLACGGCRGSRNRR